VGWAAVSNANMSARAADGTRAEWSIVKNPSPGTHSARRP
jgi:hypothetical protein